MYLCFEHHSLKLMSSYNFVALLCRIEFEIVNITLAISGDKTRKKRKTYKNKKGGEDRI